VRGVRASAHDTRRASLPLVDAFLIRTFCRKVSGRHTCGALVADLPALLLVQQILANHTPLNPSGRYAKRTSEHLAAFR